MNDEKRSRVEIRAYEIWDRKGRPQGKAMEHWYEAVAEIAREDAAAASAKGASPRKKADTVKPARRTAKAAGASPGKKTTKSVAKKADAPAKTKPKKKTKKSMK